MCRRLLALVMLFSVLALPVSASKPLQKVSGLNVSLETVKFLEGLRNPNGTYSYGAPCKNDHCIPAGVPLQQNNAWLTLAYVGLYDATGDPAYKENIRENMDALRQICPPDDPHCFFVGVQAAKAYEAVGDESYLDYLRNMSVFYIHSDPLLMIKAIMARQLVMQSRYLGADVQDAARFVSDADEYVDESPLVVPTIDFRSGSCWMQLAWLELASLPDDVLGAGVDDPDYPVYYRENILAFHPKKFFSENDFSVLFNGSYPDVYSLILTELFPCVEALHMLHNLTGDQQYMDDAYLMEWAFLRNRWDSNMSPKFTGDGGFLAQGCVDTENDQSCYLNSKVLNDNSYAVYLYAKHKDLTYLVPTDVKVSYYSEPAADPVYPSLPTTTMATPPAEPSKKNRLIIILSALVLVSVIAYYLVNKKGVPGR